MGTAIGQPEWNRARLRVLWVDWGATDAVALGVVARYADVLKISPSLKALERIDTREVAGGIFDVDGATSYDAVNRFKSLAPGIPLVLIASSKDPTMLLWALRTGVRDVLEKPLAAAAVARVLQQLHDLAMLRNAGASRRQALLRGDGRSDGGALLGVTGRWSREEMIAARIKSYVDQHLAEPIPVQDIAEACGCSAEVCLNVAKRKLGHTLQTYVVLERVARARELLANTSLPISVVSWQSGFKEVAYFCRTFRRVAGISPKAFRQQQADSQAGPEGDPPDAPGGGRAS